jgi:energy-coupling factor transport system permease protein
LVIYDERPHALAWWLWAGGLALVALRLSNPVVLAALAAVVITVALLRQSPAPWGRSLGVFVKLGLVVIVLRVFFQILFGQRIPGHVLFTLPSVALPAWAEGVSLGGPVTVEGLVVAGIAGLRLALVLLCFGAANSIASPREVLRSLPGILNEVAVAVTVGMCFIPELMASVTRVRAARKLRGRPISGIAGLRGIAVPVLEDALERSMELAGSMGSRGFGRAAPSSSRRRTVLCALSAGVGALALVIGVYGLLAPQSAVPLSPLLCAAGVGLLALGVMGSGRRSQRTRYRPTPFGWHSWCCALSGWLVVGAIALLGAFDPSAVSYSPYPLVWPAFSPPALVGVALGLIPLFVSTSPVVESSRARAPIEVLA